MRSNLSNFIRWYNHIQLTDTFLKSITITGGGGFYAKSWTMLQNLEMIFNLAQLTAHLASDSLEISAIQV